MAEHPDQPTNACRCPRGHVFSWRTVVRIGLAGVALLGLAFAWLPGALFWFGWLAVAILLRWAPVRSDGLNTRGKPSADSALAPHWWSASPVVLYQLDLVPVATEPRQDQISENLRTVFDHDPQKIDNLYDWWLAHIHPDDVAEVQQASDYAQWPAQGTLRRYRFLTGQGQFIWVADSARVLRDEAGVPRWVVGSLFNIESQIQLRLQLEREEQRYRLITQHLQEVVGLHAADGRLLWLTPSCRSVFGYRPEQLLAESVERFLDPEAWQTWLRLRAEGAEAWLDRSLTFRFLMPNGEWRWMESRFTRFVGEHMVGGASLQSVTRDVHERVMLQQQLREREQLYRSIFEHVDALIFVVGVEPDGDFMFLANNPCHQAITGLSAEQMTRKRPHELLPTDLADWIISNYRECVARRAPLHYVQYGDWLGTQRYLDMVLTPIFDAEGEVSLIVGLGTDVTEQRQQFLTLQRTSHRLQQVTEVAQLGYFSGDLQQGRLNWSANLLRWFGEDQMLRSPATGLLPPVLSAFAGLMSAVAVTDRPRLVGLLVDLAQGVLGEFRRDVLMRRQNGEERWMSWSVQRQSAAPAILRIEGSLQDVTERITAEQQAARSGRRDAAVLRTVAEGIVGVDAEGNLSFANPAARQLLGWVGQSVTGRSAAMLYDNRLPTENFLSALTDGRSRTGVQSEFYRQGEGFFPVRWSVTVLPDEFDVEKNGLVVVFSDISAMKRHEAMLARLATTDELTGLPNRRDFMVRLDEEFARTGRYATPASILMLDIDHFKQVNDTHGHAVGDLLLQSFAELLREKLRRPDIVGRLGGEEFAILLPNTPCRGAYEIAERLRLAIAAMRVPSVGGEIYCTVSIGVCDLQHEASSASEALNRADRALYRAKSSGRNRVCGCEGVEPCAVSDATSNQNSVSG